MRHSLLCFRYQVLFTSLDLDVDVVARREKIEALGQSVRSAALDYS